MTPDTEIVTYSLRGPDGTSDGFYRDLAAFADEVLAEARARLQARVDGLQAWVQSTGREERRDASEVVYDCLNLGVLWTVHAGRPAALPSAPRAALGLFSRLRRKRGIAEDIADVFRGAISGLWLARAGRAAAAGVPDLVALRALRDWLV